MENEQTGQEVARSGHKRVLPWVVVVLGISALGFCAVVMFRPRGPAERDFEIAIRTLKVSGLTTGSHPSVSLPPSSRHMSDSGTVSAVVTADGRLVVLFKTTVGWKGNYEGFVYSDTPLKTGEISTDHYGRAIIAIDGLDTNYPVVRKQRTPRWFEVFFDLG